MRPKISHTFRGRIFVVIFETTLQLAPIGTTRTLSKGVADTTSGIFVLVGEIGVGIVVGVVGVVGCGICKVVVGRVIITGHRGCRERPATQGSCCGQYRNKECGAIQYFPH